MTATTECQVRAGQRRILHAYTATVLSDCTPARHGEPDWCQHRVRFDTLAVRATGELVETNAYGLGVRPGTEHHPGSDQRRAGLRAGGEGKDDER